MDRSTLPSSSWRIALANWAAAVTCVVRSMAQDQLSGDSGNFVVVCLAGTSAWPREGLFAPSRFGRPLEQFARLRSVGRGKPRCPPEAVGGPPGVDGCDTPRETGGKVARLLIARHKSKGIKGLRKVP